MHIISFYLGLKFNDQNVDQLKIFFEKIRQTFVAMLNLKNKPVNEYGVKKVMMKWVDFKILHPFNEKGSYHYKLNERNHWMDFSSSNETLRREE
jgi:hypothetical protein